MSVSLGKDSGRIRERFINQGAQCGLCERLLLNLDLSIKRRPVTQSSKDGVFLVEDISLPETVEPRQFSLFPELTG